ncbi:hypothetical protein Tco_1551640, partial [Tanacetum coccineum]
TDNANITRKCSKPDKHEHENGKSAQEARRHHVLLLAGIDKRNDTLASYKHTREEKFALKPLVKKHRKGRYQSLEENVERPRSFSLSFKYKTFSHTLGEERVR